MKTKLATLLIAPALLFTACGGAKEISFKEAFDFVQKNYTIEKDKLPATANGNWDISKTDKAAQSDMKDIIEMATCCELGEGANAEIKDEAVEAYVMNVSALINYSHYFLTGTPRFYLSGNELSMQGYLFPALATKGISMPYIDTKFTFDEKGRAKEVKINIEPSDIDSDFNDDKIHIEGNACVSYTYTE